MGAQILSGKEAAAALLEELKPKIQQLDPKLVIVQVGDDPGSETYIKQKLKTCSEVGMRTQHKHLPTETTREELLKTIRELNDDSSVTGFIVQLPLPPHLQHCMPEVQVSIHPDKDVDGFGPYNLGSTFLSAGQERIPPATPAGIITLLEFHKIPIEGKHAVVVGRSNTAGKPLAVMLLNRHATVTICHSRTKNLAELTRQADLLFVAVGTPKLITKDIVKPGAVVIDIGVNHTPEGIKGDVDFEAVKEIASAITPVPGGVGPMTVASLLRNVVKACDGKIHH